LPQGIVAYQADKFIQRHRAGVAATCVAMLALTVGVGATLREARVARAERARAERRFDDVRKLANSLIFEIDGAIRDLPGSTTARKLLVSQALEYLDSLSREAKGDESLERELATANERGGMFWDILTPQIWETLLEPCRVTRRP
jgi:hypothetical protein